MAHEIETHGNQAAFISARQDAWHRLGTVVSTAFTASEAMTIGHLGGWNVRKVALTVTEVGPDGVTRIEVPDNYATVRTNPFHGGAEALGVVGSRYTVVQNEEHAELLDLLVDESGAHFETAGSLKGGRQTFITMKLPQSMQIGGVDRHDLYVAALNSHDGSSQFKLIVTPIRVVCANTQAIALRNAKASFSIRHTGSARTKIQSARAALGLTWKYVEAFENEAKRMIEAELTNAEFRKITARVFGEPAPGATNQQKRTHAKLEQELAALFTNAATQEAIRGTRWAGLQAIVEYVDHAAPVRTSGNRETARAERALTSTWATGIKHTAHELLAV